MRRGAEGKVARSAGGGACEGDVSIPPNLIGSIKGGDNVFGRYVALNVMNCRKNITPA